MAFIKLDRPLELTEGEDRRNIRVDDEKVYVNRNWLIFSYEEHTFQVPHDEVAFVRYDNVEVEDPSEGEEEPDIIIS